MVFITSFLLVGTNLDNNNWSNSFSIFGQLFSLVLIFLFVLFLAFFSTKLIASSRFSRKKSSNIFLIDSLSVGYNNHLQIIKVGEQFFLIAMNKDGISLISSLEKENIAFDYTTETDLDKSFTFDKVLSHFFNK